SGVVGLGRLFEAAFDISYHAGIVIGLFTAMLYTLIGGFVAAAWCDLFQGLFLLCMIILVPTVAFFNTNGISSLIDAYHSQAFSLSFIHNMPYGLFLAAGWGLGYFGQPHILVNFMGIDDPKKINSAQYVGLTWQIIVLFAAIAIGLIALTFFPSPIENPELVYILMTKSLFSPFVAGLALCAIFAATLSTMDRHILISGSVIASDLYQKIINPHASSQQILVAVVRQGADAPRSPETCELRSILSKATKGRNPWRIDRALGNTPQSSLRAGRSNGTDEHVWVPLVVLDQCWHDESKHWSSTTSGTRQPGRDQ
ncbi:MAG: hypothetical protein ABI353_04730, partial [Isosphaeraceae bacterium]